MQIVGRSPEDIIISGPLNFDFENFDGKTLPPKLAKLDSLCKLKKDSLQCRYVPTDARKPENYRFELTVISEGRRGRNKQTSKQISVVIDPIPQPKVMLIDSMQPIYQQQSTANAKDSGVNKPSGEIKLEWDVAHLENLSTLVLQIRSKDGTPINEIVYDFLEKNKSSDEPENEQKNTEVKIPPELKSYCTIKSPVPELNCNAVPTGIEKPGEYTFALTAQPLDATSTPPESIVSDVVKIESIPPEIESFSVIIPPESRSYCNSFSAPILSCSKITSEIHKVDENIENGRKAQPKYLLPVDQGDPLPVVEFTWKVNGATDDTTVKLLPVPGNVQLQGAVKLTLSEPPSTEEVTLEATNSKGQTVTRSVILETFDPTPF